MKTNALFVVSSVFDALLSPSYMLRCIVTLMAVFIQYLTLSRRSDCAGMFVPFLLWIIMWISSNLRQISQWVVACCSHSVNIVCSDWWRQYWWSRRSEENDVASLIRLGRFIFSAENHTAHLSTSSLKPDNQLVSPAGLFCLLMTD